MCYQFNCLDCIDYMNCQTWKRVIGFKDKNVRFEYFCRTNFIIYKKRNKFLLKLNRRLNKMKLKIKKYLSEKPLREQKKLDKMSEMEYYNAFVKKFKKQIKKWKKTWKK